MVYMVVVLPGTFTPADVSLIQLIILRRAKTKRPFAAGFGDSVVGKKRIPRLVVGIGVLGLK